MSNPYRLVTGTKAQIADDVKKYSYLQLSLWIIHYSCAFAIVGINLRFPDTSFKVDYNFLYNLWDSESGDGTCESGCTVISKEYTYPNQLNVNVLVSFFSFVSGTNHLIQWTVSTFFPNTFDRWLQQKYFSVRSIDFGVSAGLMLLANSILFYAPPDIQTMVLFFLFQCLTQLGGFSSEVFFAKGENEIAKNVFWVSGVLYLIPWSLRFAMFFLTVSSGSLGDGVDANNPPIQVWFFLAWIFQTFMLFPLAHWFKIHEKDFDESKCLQYEIVYSLLSFLAKLPLLSVFIGGSFQRDAFTQFESDEEDNAVAPGGFDGNTYLALFLPMAVSLVGSAVMVYFFWVEIGLEDLGSKWQNFKQVGKVCGKCAGYLLIATVVSFIPIFVGLGNNDATLVTYIGLTLPPFLVTVAWFIDVRFF